MARRIVILPGDGIGPEIMAPTLRLLARDPFAGQRPRFVRALLYLYRFTTPAERRASGAWWSRELVGDYVRALALRA